MSKITRMRTTVPMPIYMHQLYPLSRLSNP